MVNMRPPHKRNFTGVVPHIRPSFGAPPGPTPATRVPSPPKVFDDMLKQAVQRGHEQNVIPLQEVNHLRDKSRLGDLSRHAPRPRLTPRPKSFAPVLVRTYY